MQQLEMVFAGPGADVVAVPEPVAKPGVFPELYVFPECGLFPLNPAYRVWTDGTVESCAKMGPGGGYPTGVWRPVKLSVHLSGYVVFCARLNGVRSLVTAHTAVLLTFVGPCPPGLECRHLDNDQTNNRLTNLRWGNRVKQTDDKVLHGTLATGERHGRSKLTDAQRAEIRAAHAAGATLRELAVRYGVDPRTVWYVVHDQPARDARRARRLADLLAEAVQKFE